MDRQEVYTAVCAAVKEAACEPLPGLQPDSTFDSLGIDSLDLVNICHQVGERFGLRLEQYDVRGKIEADGARPRIENITIGQFTDKVLELGKHEQHE